MKLPDYSPPFTARASLAVGLAPLLVLAAFVLIVTRLMEVDTGFAVFAACAVWVATEMHDYQRTLDAYNAGYVHSHLAWRSSDLLASLAASTHTSSATREFVQRYLADDRQLQPDRPALQ